MERATGQCVMVVAVLAAVLPASALAQRARSDGGAGATTASSATATTARPTGTRVPGAFDSARETTGGTGGVVGTGSTAETATAPTAAAFAPSGSTDDPTVEARPANAVDVITLLRSRRGPLEACYATARTGDAHLGPGRVSLRFTVGADGHVLRPSASGFPATPSIATCVTTALGTLAFPRPESGPIVVDTSINFAAPAAAPTRARPRHH